MIDELASAIQYAVCRFKRVTPELQAQPKFPGGVTAAHTGISDHGGILSRQCMKANLEIPGSFSFGKATIRSSFKSTEPRLTETQSWWPSSMPGSMPGKGNRAVNGRDKPLPWRS